MMPMSALTEDAKRPNEFGRLATLFLKMIAEVRARHRLLEIQLEQLRVDVNDEETEAEVQAIAESDFFQGLRATALKLRGSIDMMSRFKPEGKRVRMEESI